MPAYAVAHLWHVTRHADVLDYMRRIQATLDPFGGRFLVHGGPLEVREGAWPGDLVILEFPTRAAARAWYESPAYQAVLPLRTRHVAAHVALVDGVERDHDSAAMADRLAAAWFPPPESDR